MRLADELDMKFVVVLGLSAVLAVTVLGCIKKSEVDEELAQYCNNVARGSWPDYEPGRFKRDCGGTEPPRFIEK